MTRFIRPDLGAMRLRLPDLGESLHTSALELSRELSLDRCDRMLDRIRGAEHSIRHLRQALAEALAEGKPAGT
jgi:hypothetical protein